jgi:SAM-dependent methyltransferase
VKGLLVRTPLLGPLARWVGRTIRERGFGHSSAFWERRYASGHGSGSGSCGRLAEFKAEVVNGFVAEHAVDFVIELGCGDGNQLALARYPRYLGYDVSPTAVRLCRERFAKDDTKEFRVLDGRLEARAPLVLSLDVIYHLVEDATFEGYMRRLFDASERFVIVYSSDLESDPSSSVHVRHRKFTRWISTHRPGWKLVRRVPNRYPLEKDPEGSFADFWIFERDTAASA